jgi:hypothetical protein
MDMHPVRLFAAFAFLIGISISAATSALAAPPRVEGQQCAPARAPAGKWIGFFDGHETTSRFVSREDAFWPVTEWRCFNNKADCLAWKYWMQTDYRASQTWCRRK